MFFIKILSSCAVTFDVGLDTFSDFLRERRPSFFRGKISVNFRKFLGKSLLFRDRLVHIRAPVEFYRFSVSSFHLFSPCYLFQVLLLYPSFGYHQEVLEKFLFLFFSLLIMFYILFRIFLLSSGFFKKSRKSFFTERDPAGVSLDVRTRQSRICSNLDTFSRRSL